jgi:spermidine/putrescine transport system ATP-binding protein
MALLEIHNVTCRMGDAVAIDDVSLTVEAGEFFALLGPSGCGNSALLRVIAGFDALERGSILIDGVDQSATPPEARAVHMLFQRHALFPHMTVECNIAFPLRMAGIAEVEIRERVDQALENARLKNKAKRYPKELSDFQRWQVAVARALMRRPRILLLDQPFAGLEASQREQMQGELMQLQRAAGVAFVYATSDPTEALSMSDRIAVMNRGQVQQLDEPAKVYAFPVNRFVAEYVGPCNLLECRVRSMNMGRMRLEVAGCDDVAALTGSGKMPGTKGALVVRPERVRMQARIEASEEENRFKAKITERRFLGDTCVYVAELQTEEGPGHSIQAAIANSRYAHGFELGDLVEVAWRHDTGHFIEE